MLTLRLQHVSLGYSKKTVIHDITFEAMPGQMLGIIGPNGSGKSTIIKGISRIITPRSGYIFLDGLNVAGMSRESLAKLVAVVPQNPFLPELFTAFELVLLGRTPHLGLFRYETENDYAIVRHAMQLTNTIDLAERRIGELSGGERQRLTIARALAQEPQVILLDEPTAHLDINYQSETLDMVQNLCRQQGLIVVTTLHDLNMASQYCDRLIMLNNGRIHSEGTPENVVNVQAIKEVYGADVYVYPHPMNNLPTTYIAPHKNGPTLSRGTK